MLLINKLNSTQAVPTGILPRADRVHNHGSMHKCTVELALETGINARLTIMRASTIEYFNVLEYLVDHVLRNFMQKYCTAEYVRSPTPVGS